MTGSEWNRTTRYIVGVGLALFTLYLLYISRQVLPLFILAALLSFIIRPAVSFANRRLRIPRPVAVPVVYLLALAIISASPLVLVPTVITAVEFLASLDYQQLITNLFQWVRDWLVSLQEINIQILGFNLNFDGFVNPLLESLQDSGQIVIPSLPPLSVIINSINSAFSFSLGITVGVVGTVFSVALALIYLFVAGIYLSQDGGRLIQQFIASVPESTRPEITILLHKLEHIWDSFFRGQLSLMVLIGVVVWLGGAALGLPGAFALGVIAGLLEIIPSIGPILSTIPALIVALLQGSSYLPVNNVTFMLIVLGFYFLVQQLENYIIVPRVLGQAVELHPLVVLTGVLVGATVFGILGALLASPTIASIFLLVRYLYRKITNQEAFVPRDLAPPAPPEPVFSGKVKEMAGKLRKMLPKRTPNGRQSEETKTLEAESSDSASKSS